MPDLSNVPPSETGGNHVDVALACAISGSYDTAIMSCRTVSPYLENGFLRQLCHWVLRSNGVAPSLLALAIQHILRVCSKKEVLQITTWWVIASVAHLKPSLYLASGENPKQSMRPENFPSESKTAVPPWVSIPAPFEAAIWHWNTLGNDILLELGFSKSNHLRSPLPILAHAHYEFVNHLAMLCRNIIRLN